jgi:hypothetical protein
VVDTHTLDGLGGGGVLEDDAELGEVGGELAEVLEEVLLSVEDRDVLLGQRVGNTFRANTLPTFSSSLGTSPWRLSTMFSSSIALKTG